MKIAKILLLEDDELLGLTIVEILQNAGYLVDLAKDGGEAAELSYVNDYNLYIFDINVPEINGLDLLKSLRHAGDNTPTIYMSAMVDIETIAKGFDAGAEEYLKKPFLPEELLIRIDAKMKINQQHVIVYKNIEYYPDTKEVYIDDRIISLGNVQIRLFDTLMHNVGKIALKETLLDQLEHPSDTALRVAMAKLKQKLKIDITNVRGLGYILEKI